MRGVPDVAGDADPETGYDVRVDGTDTVIGGTSAVAPLWAALDRAHQCLDRAEPRASSIRMLYQNPKDLRDITQGNNGDFAAQRAGMPAPASAARTAAALARRRCASRSVQSAAGAGTGR